MTELEKMQDAQDRSQPIGEFLETSGYVLCHEHTGSDGEVCYQPVSETVEQVLAGYFGVDLERAEQERSALLEWVREQQS